MSLRLALHKGHQGVTRCALPRLGIRHDPADVEALCFGQFVADQANLVYDGIFPHETVSRTAL